MGPESYCGGATRAADPLHGGRRAGDPAASSGGLPAGEELQEHEVHEHARIVVIEGEVEAVTPKGESVSASGGHLLEFAPGERRTVAAQADAKLLLLLTPWPGDGHPGAMTLEEKAEVRERAAQHSP